MGQDNSRRNQTRPAQSRALPTNVSLPGLTAALLSLATTAFWTGSTRAADAPAAATAEQRSNNSLEEIVVTARKREEPLQITPVSISATSGATLEQAQVTRIDDIAQFAP